MKRHLGLAFFCAVWFIACNEAGQSTSTADSGALSASDAVEVTGSVETAEITPIDTNSDNDAAMASYALTAFSKYVYIQADAKTFLIDFNFFPAGTDFDSQNKTATLPCDAVEGNESGATVSMSAAGEDEECAAVVVDLSQATFTFVGLEFSFEASLDVFAETFEFKITPEGITDAADGELIELDAEDANLENAYNAVMDRRL